MNENFIERPQRTTKMGRPRAKKYDAIAAAILVLPEGKALPVPIPEGKSFKQFKHSLTISLQRRGIKKLKINQVNESEIAVWL